MEAANWPVSGSAHLCAGSALLLRQSGKVIDRRHGKGKGKGEGMQ